MKNSKYTRKAYKPMAIVAIFGAAAGVYASSGWTVSPDGTVVNQAGTTSFNAPIQTGTWVDNGEITVPVNKVDVAGQATITYDVNYNKDAQGVVFSGSDNILTIGEGATLEVVSSEGSATAVIGAKDIVGNEGKPAGAISVEAKGDAVAVSSEEANKINLSKVTAVSTDGGKAIAVDVAKADRVDIREATGEVNVDAANYVSVKAGQDVNLGTVGQLDVGDVENITGKDVGVVNVNNAVNVSLDKAGEVVVHEAFERVDIKEATGEVRVVEADMLSVKAGQNVTAGTVDEIHLGTVKDVTVDTAVKGAYIDTANDVSVKNVGELVTHHVNNVNAETVDSLRVQEAKGHVDVATANGDVSVEAANSLTVKVGQNVTAGTIAGAIDIDSATNVTIGAAADVTVGTANSVDIDTANSLNITDVVNVKANAVNGDATIGLNAGEMNAGYVDGKLTVSGTGNVKVNEVGSLDAGTVDFDSFVAQENFVKLEGANMNIVGAGTTLNDAGEEVSTAVNVAGDIKVQSATTAKLDGYVGNVEIGTSQDVAITNGIAGDLTLTEATKVAIEGGVAGNATMGLTSGDVKADYFEGSLTVSGTGNVKVNEVGSLDAGTVDFDSFVAQENFVKLEGANMNIVGAGTTLNEAGEEVSTAVNVASDIKVQSATNAKLDGYVGNVEIGTSKDVTITNGVDGNLTVGLDAGKLVGDAVSGKLTLSGTGEAQLNYAGSLDANANFDSLKTQGNIVNLEGDIKISGIAAPVVGTNPVADESGIGVATDLEVQKVTNADINGYAGNVVLGEADATVVAGGSATNLTIENATTSVEVKDSLASLDVTGTGATVTAGEGAVITDLTVAGNLNVDVKEATNVTANGVEQIKVYEQSITFVPTNADLKGTVANVSDSVSLSTKDTNSYVDVSYFEGTATLDGNNGGTIAVNSEKADVIVKVGADTKLNVENSKSVQVEGAEGAEVSINTSNLDLVNKDETVTTTYQFKDANGNEITSGIDLNNISVTTVVTDADGNVTTGATINANLKGDEKSVTLDTLDKDTSLTFAGGDLTVDEAKGRLDIAEVKDVTVGSANSLSVKAGENVTAGTVDQIHLGTVNDVTVDTATKGAYIDTANDVSVKNVGEFVAHNVNNVNAETAGSLNVVKAKGNVTASEVAGTTVIDSANAVEITKANGTVDITKADSLVITEARGNVTVVKDINSVDVGLTNDAVLMVKGIVVNQARVNGGCDATFDSKVGNVLVDKGLNGTLTLNGGVENTIVANNVEKIVFGGDHSVGGDVTLGGDAVIETTGKTTFNGNITADADLVLDGNKIELRDSNGDPYGKIEVKGTLSGTAAKDTVETIYDSRYNILTSKPIDATHATNTLVGNHAVENDVAAGDLGFDDNFESKDGSINGKYISDGKIAYEVTKNSYFQDNAKTENEKAMAAALDSIAMENEDGVVTDNDKAAGEMKYNYAENGLTSAVPESVSNAVRNNMELANMVHLDTMYRTSATRDMLNKFAKAKAEAEARFDQSVENMNIEGTSMVSVRNMNRVASYGSDSNASGSDNYVFGGLVNVDYIVNEDLFFGAGVGGFESKSSGRGVAGDAEAESVVLNAYGDYAFAENFDWYFGATYSFNMNDAERTDSNGKIARQDWDSHTIGLFSGVRYTWKPLENQEFYVKPLVGVNANFVLGEDSTSRGSDATDTIRTDIGDYTSFKSVVGVELTYDFSNGFYLTGRMLYTHEFADDSYDFNASLMGVNAANGTFRVRGNEVDRDAGIFSIGAGYSFNQNWSVYLDYAAEVTSDVFHNINAGIQYKF